MLPYLNYHTVKIFSRIHLILFIVLAFAQCNREGIVDDHNIEDYSGVYCLNMQNLEMTLIQQAEAVNFTLNSGLLLDGEGTAFDNIIQLSAVTPDSQSFSASITFSADKESFTGPYELTNMAGITLTEGILLGNKGTCPEYDITNAGIPKFVRADFTNLAKIEKISKFRSGFGHSFTDGFEECRSMKHYFNPYEIYRKNNTVQIFSPVTGTIISITNDGYGESLGLTNKLVHIRPDDQPAFIFVLFHVDLLSPEVVTGKRIQRGEPIGYAHLYYDDLDEYVTSFDIAAWVNTPSGLRLISYIETLDDEVFEHYASRGVLSRDEFIITREVRDANPLECNGESFVTSDNPDNWVILH
jgi:hypothetical protein